MPHVDLQDLAACLAVDGLFFRCWWLPRIRANGHGWQVYLPPVLIVAAGDLGMSVRVGWDITGVHFLGVLILTWLGGGGGGGGRRKKEPPREESPSLLDGMRGVPA